MNFLCFRYNFISITIFCSTFIFFIFSSLRHILFQSTAWDLAIFDQAVYLISQGKIPNSSFLNIHILGDHASLILYPLSLFYVFYQKKFSLFAIGSGLTWFIVSTKVIIPIFGNNNSNIERHIERFNYLGNTFSEITHNLFFRPTLVLEGIFNLSNFGYLLLLMAPIFWGISLVSLSPLISCIPSFAINLLSQNILQKDLLHHYSLPILPFLMVVVIKTIAQRKKPIWRKYIFLWSLISFIALAKLGNFTSRYLVSLDMWTANTEAINKIYDEESVLTYSYIAPHISHRSIVKLIEQEANINLEQFNNILLNDVFPQSENIKRRIQESDHFSLTFQKNNVYLFQKNNV